MRVGSLPAVVLSVICGSAGATVLQVPSPEHPTIQSAVDAAAATGDTVMVAAGTYPEDVSIHGKEIAILGSGAAWTQASSFTHTAEIGFSIPCGGTIAGFTVTGALAAEELHSPFTLAASSIEGDASLYQRVYGSSLTILDCRFAQDLSVASEVETAVPIIRRSEIFGDLVAAGDDPEVSDCTVHGGAQVSCGFGGVLQDSRFLAGLFLTGGIATWIQGNEVWGSASVSVDGTAGECWILENVGRWGGFSASGYHLWIRGNVVTEGVTGIFVLAPAVIEENTVVGCSDGGLSSRYGVVESIARNIVVENRLGIIVPAGTDSSLLACNDVHANAETNWVGVPDQSGANGNFSLDPRFCSKTEGDFTLAEDSPCLPGNHPDGVACDRIGALDQGCPTPLEIAEPDAAPEPVLQVLGPNPSPAGMRFELVLRESRNVGLHVFDLSGREIQTLAHTWLTPGRHVISWDGQTSNSEPLASGVYFVQPLGLSGVKPVRIVLMR